MDPIQPITQQCATDTINGMKVLQMLSKRRKRSSYPIQNLKAGKELQGVKVESVVKIFRKDRPENVALLRHNDQWRNDEMLHSMYLIRSS
jgi:hypothetical protein